MPSRSPAKGHFHMGARCVEERHRTGRNHQTEQGDWPTSAARLRADIAGSLDSVITQLQQLSTLQKRQATAVADHQSAAESALSALQAV